jgi:hypothetical protein
MVRSCARNRNSPPEKDAGARTRDKESLLRRLAFRLLKMLLHNTYSGEPAKNRVFAAVGCGKFPGAGQKFDPIHHHAREDMSAHEPPTIDDWLQLVQAEYQEMPGLTLTKPQVRRLWQLEPEVCDEVLEALVSSEFLEHTPKDSYVLSSSRRH